MKKRREWPWFVIPFVLLPVCSALSSLLSSQAVAMPEFIGNEHYIKLLMADPIAAAFDAITEHNGVKPHILYMSPRGRVLNQAMVKDLAKHESLVLLCGHYEGVDARVLEEYDVEEVSIGDFVLTGGELPAVILTDAVARMLPGVLSEDVCFEEESHFDGLLEYPQYTRPANWRGRTVPEVLLSGHHEKIRKWRRGESLKITRKMRPDLFQKVQLTKEDRRLLEEK